MFFSCEASRSSHSSGHCKMSLVLVNKHLRCELQCICWGDHLWILLKKKSFQTRRSNQTLSRYLSNASIDFTDFTELLPTVTARRNKL